MGLSVYSRSKEHKEKKFNIEEEFEQIIKNNFKTIFGPKTIYIDLKNKLETKLLGGTIPDGVLFDLSDKEDPQFYLIEVELGKHDFFRHVFPQITKFFALYKNDSARSVLIERLHQFIANDPKVLEEFKQLSSQSDEIYKYIKDSIENSQNILLIVDEQFREIEEIKKTYTDTWGKFVKVEILKVFTDGENQILTLEPRFEELDELEVGNISETGLESNEIYDEEYHLDGVSQAVTSVYNKIKEKMTGTDSGIRFNPQHYYISIRKNRNFAFIKPRTKKLKIVVMLPIDVGKSVISNHKIRQLSEGVRNFYGGPCFEVQIENDINLEEIFNILEQAYNKQKSEQ
jgi:predicted transport protein